MYEVTGKDVSAGLRIHEKAGRRRWNQVLDDFTSVYEINPHGVMIELGEQLRERRKLRQLRERLRKEVNHE